MYAAFATRFGMRGRAIIGDCHAWPGEGDEHVVGSSDAWAFHIYSPWSINPDVHRADRHRVNPVPCLGFGPPRWPRCDDIARVEEY